MSIKDPLLKELKGFATKLLTECHKPITDGEPALLQFCECLEKILSKGLIPLKTVISVVQVSDCWYWLEKLADEKWGVPFAYASSIDEVKKSQRVRTNRGRVRLLIRSCLVKKCLHFPIDFIVNEDRYCLLYSSENSILANNISASVLASILHCLATVAFQLDLANAAFLDSTWELPTTVSFTFVPTKKLGLSIVFVKGKAIIYEITDGSIAAENSNIMIGDVLDTVNGLVIDSHNRGSLSKLMKQCSKQPVTICIVKAVMPSGASGDSKLYSPIVPLLREGGLDPAIIQARDSINQFRESTKEEKERIWYLGSVKTGVKGDVAQIRQAINSLLESEAKSSVAVSIECLHLGLKVIAAENQRVLFEHTYMEISSCGGSSSPMNYFGFIAGDTSYTECKDFVCHVFYSKNQDLVDSLLKTIGQGFRRTLFTV